MKKSNFNKTKRIVLLLLFSLGMFTSTLGKLVILGSNNKVYEENNEALKEEYDFNEPLLKLSEPIDFDGNGEQMNVTLHQSLINTSTIGFANLDISNSFLEPFPNFNGYSTSFINTTIESIYAPNKTLNIEDSPTAASFISDPHYTSFEVKGDCYLESISVKIEKPISGGCWFYIDLYNAQESGGYIKWNTDQTGAQYLDQYYNDTGSAFWYNVTNIHHFLDVSSTYNNTFFILIDTVSGTGRWHFEPESNHGGNDDTIVWFGDTGPVNNYDMSLLVDLSPNGETNDPYPSDLNLKINNTDVSDITNGQGYWNPSDNYYTSSNQLEFVITSDWYDVSCDITNVQINYTKTDLKANSEFEILQSGNSVQWNVSVTGGLNYFDDRITHFNTINFTIPSTWNSIKVFNETEIPSADINKDFIKNSYREVQVLNAGNGSNWYLIANSTNLLSSINTYVGGISRSIVNFSNNVEFRGTFSEIVSDGILNLSVYSPIVRDMNHTMPLDISTETPNSVFSVSTWDISLDAKDYGVFKAQMSWNNDTAAGFIDYYFTIVGDTSLTILDPPENSVFLKDQFFNITIEYADMALGRIISNGEVGYSLDGGSTYNYTTVQHIGNGQYNLTVRVADPDFPTYGFVDVVISAAETFYVNQTDTYTFHRQITTEISPGNSADLGNIIRGQNVSYTFNFYDTDLNDIIGASWEVIGNDFNFDSFLQDYGDGSYTMHLDTDDVDLGSQTFTFNVSKIGAETQIIQLTVYIQIIITQIESTSWTYDIVRHSGLNQSFNFYFNDTTNDLGIETLEDNDIVVKDNSTGIIWAPGWDLINLTGGYYTLNISLTGKNAGWYTLEVNASKFPNYYYDLSYLTFYLRGNISVVNFKSFYDPGGTLRSTSSGYNFTIFEGSDTIIEFNITDIDNDNKLVSTLADSYIISYENINTGSNGSIVNLFQIVTQNHRGTISTSDPALVIGNYKINITINKLNYEQIYFIFNLTVRARFEANLTTIVPDSVNAGLPFTIIVKAEYFNGSNWLPIEGSSINCTPYYNGLAGSLLGPYSTNSTGEVEFIVPTYSDTNTLNLTIQLSIAYNHQEYSIEISDITIIPPSGLNLEELLPYIIIAAVIVVGILGAVAIHRGVIAPKKREKARILNEVKTIFDDAINLEHILVLYKETGTCVYFKSYGSEQIDPELIGGFLTAVSSFGREMVAQEALNEISYGDKMLLLADGEYIRIALVLTKKASLILRRNLKEFINVFEKTYKDVLPNWRGQLAHFRTSGQIVDELLNTSIILPHQISYDFSSIKELKNPHSKEVLKIAHSCCEEADRQFFFIATLLKEASERTNKDTAEIFMGIKELRDRKMLIPIEISALEAQPISQQEINLINQKVLQLTTLSPEEKQKLVNDLAQMGPVEREAYLSSITERHKIVSAPIKSKIGNIEIANKKEAKSGIKELFNRAKKAKSKKNYLKSVEIFQEAALIASNWELSKEFMQLEELTRKTKIEDLTSRKKQFENEAKLAVKKKNYLEAAQKYKQASKVASEIFKLGVTNMTKEVKRLTNKANEYEKLK